MYNTEYARQWIRHAQSGKDALRANHLHPFIKDSITNFSKAKIGGKVVIADFSDGAEKSVRGSFLKVYDESRNYVRGLYRLSNEVNVVAEVYFHKQKDIGRVLWQQGRFDRELLGSYFVGYTVRRAK